MTEPYGVTILGSTGSIGVSTLDVLARNPERFRVVALTANRHVERLYQQILTYKPQYAVMNDPDAAEQLVERLQGTGSATEVLAGAAGLEQVVTLVQTRYVMAAIVGAAGLAPTLAAARAGKQVLLANKEALVMTGRLFMDELRAGGGRLLPIDSEHNAVFQSLPDDFQIGSDRSLADYGVDRIILTASGGPFRDVPPEQLTAITPDQACAHPNWVMGRKISVDSATLMNKGLEVIEACWLFNAMPDEVEVVIHPQSVIHSMVAYSDGSVLAELGQPDMRTPIAHALAWPERIGSGVAALDLCKIGRLDFQPPDRQRFPCLQLAYDALAAGGTAAAVLNAANEVAVAAFLDHKLAFNAIATVIERTLGEVSPVEADSLATVLDSDSQARQVAGQAVSDLAQEA